MPARIATVVGARPQFIKAAAVSRVFAKTESLNEVLIHTGQHFDANMSDVFFDELKIPKPAFNLDIHGGGHGEMTGRMLGALEKVMVELHPDGVLIYGDTNSTLAAALAAAKLHIPIFHIEAGLRSYNRKMPEEINRLVADQLSALLFCPTSQAVTNLAAEGITKGVLMVGDVMQDAVIQARDEALQRSKILGDLDLAPRQYALATIHRAENTDDKSRLGQVIGYLRTASLGKPVILPVHPRTRAALERFSIPQEGLRLIEPLSYFDMHRLMADAAIVLTDSGGVQKEAYFHRVPCVTLRDETEWLETIEAGWNRLWTTPDYRPQHDIPDYGDGHAGEKIVQHMAEALA